MSFQVVCITRTVAAGGEAIGRTVSQRLEFRYLDREVITAAAEKAKVDPKVVAAAEHKQPLVRRLIEAIGGGPVMADPIDVSSAMSAESYYTSGMTPLPPLPEDYRALIRETIREIANAGRAVIVSHGASLALIGRADVLRVLVTASPETRARRLLAAGQARDEDDAAAIITQADRERREYIRLVYKIKEELPTHYDLIINTDLLTPKQAVNVILRLAQG